MSATVADYVGLLAKAHRTHPAPVTAGTTTDAPKGRLTAQIASLAVMHTLQSLLIIVSWVCVGSGALAGRLDLGWLMAWALALASTIPLSSACDWLEGVVAITVSVMLKKRLLRGAMSTDPDLIRTKGAGELLGETLESDAIDSLAAGAGIGVGLALLELLMAPVLLYFGAAALGEIVVLIAFVVFSLVLLAANVRQRALWTRQRIALTNRLVENMGANRSRLAQQSPQFWHREEDADLDRYCVASRELDAGTARLAALLLRAYLIVALAALLPVFMSGAASVSQLAITLGIVMSAAASLSGLNSGLLQAAEAWIAWQLIKPTLDNAKRAAAPGVVADQRLALRSVLHAQDVHFAHLGRLGGVLNGCTLQVNRGDQIILEGPSGGGKSTLAAILAGHRTPSSGFVLADGLDRHTLGDRAWRLRVALAPQYHDNHLFSASLSFNLLLSRPLPHTQADLEEAHALCQELGLDKLIANMPGGMEQMVGDTGWRVSQGERSRIFLARALLQRADMVVLDESLAALDPENLRQCVECIRRRAPTLMLIAHP